MPYANRSKEELKELRHAEYLRRRAKMDPEKRKKLAREATAKYREKHRNRLLEVGRSRRQADEEYRKKRNEATAKSRLKHRERLLAKEAERRKTDTAFIERRRDDLIRSRFGISALEYDERLAAQGGVCAICKNEIIMPALDHCHKTKKVREFLCRKHNAAIGLLDDNPTLLLSAYEYLMRHQHPKET